MANLNGTAGNDTLTMTEGADVVTALDGADTILAGGHLTAGDKIDGGAKTDTVVLDGDYSSLLAFNATTLSQVEALELRAGHNYTLKTHDATVANNAVLKVAFAGDLAAGGRVIFDGSAETNGSFEVIAAAGNDILTGGARDDVFTIGAGADTVFGNGGDDTILAKGDFTATDKIDGGSGKDILRLEGDYAQTVTLGATTLKDVEYIHLVSGHDYALKTHDANVAAGQQLSVNFIGNGDGRLLFDGSAETDGKFGVTGMNGNDVLKGGAGDDVFWVWQDGVDSITGGAGDDMAIFNDSFTASDSFIGGSGYDTLVVGAGTGAEITFNAAKISGVDEILIDKKDNGVTILTTVDAMLGAGKTLTVGFNWGGSPLNQALGFNGGAETNGRFELTGGSGNDVLIGGAGDDVFRMHKGGDDVVEGGAGDDRIEFTKNFDSNDSVDGGIGNDSLHISAFSDPVTLTGAKIRNIENLFVTSTDTASVIVADSLVASGTTFNVSSGYMAAGTTFVFDAAAEADATFGIMDHVGTDIIFGGGGKEDVDLRGGGADRVYGGGGDDLIRASDTLDAGDVINGGDGRDSVDLIGDYALTLSSTTLRNVEDIGLGAGHDYELHLHKDTIVDGQTLTVVGHWLSGDDVLVVDDATGGTGTLDVRAGSSFGNAASAVRGGSGTNDQLYLDGDYSQALALGPDKLTGIEVLGLGAGYSYSLVSHDNTVASGKTMEVRGYWLGASDKLTFDGSAETDGAFNMSGGKGNDVMKGGARNDTLRLDMGGDDSAFGGSGDDIFDLGNALGSNDRINGGAGFDKLKFNGDVTATLGGAAVKDIEAIEIASGHSYKLTVVDGLLAAGETLKMNAWYLGAADKVTLNGSAETNGAFEIVTGDADDVLSGGSVGDRLTGGAGEDTLSGGAGNDVLVGGKGADVLKGGADRDMVSYETSSEAVVVSLAAGTASGGDATGDVLTGIEDLRGSNKADTLTGDGGSNLLSGHWGDDLLSGGGGGDTLSGGDGLDTATYAGSAAGVSLSLTTGLGTSGDAAGDLLLSIENVIGSGFSDTIHGDGAKNLLIGQGGQDTLSGFGGNDKLDGGTGNDTLAGGTGSDTFIFTGAAWGADTIADFSQADGDKIDLSSYDYMFRELTISYAGGDATIVAEHGSIILKGVSAGLTVNDFLF